MCVGVGVHACVYVCVVYMWRGEGEYVMREEGRGSGKEGREGSGGANNVSVQ